MASLNCDFEDTKVLGIDICSPGDEKTTSIQMAVLYSKPESSFPVGIRGADIMSLLSRSPNGVGVT